MADSLKRIFTALSKGPHKAVLEQYAGCFNNRPMRGGSLPSLHARGAAVDLDPDSNGNHVAWPTRATMPLEVMEEFAKEGWLCAGAFGQRCHARAIHPIVPCAAFAIPHPAAGAESACQHALPSAHGTTRNTSARASVWEAGSGVANVFHL